jgi:hypothetical protein
MRGPRRFDSGNGMTPAGDSLIRTPLFVNHGAEEDVQMTDVTLTLVGSDLRIQRPSRLRWEESSGRSVFHKAPP